jgi:NAD(P)-dependent dehydrogenase (short-subunit alcohol dehydrogenase family)
MASSESKTVFLTGASSGIGLETAKLLTTRGFEVWGTSRNPARLPKLPRFHSVSMDLTQSDSICENFAAALQQAGGFDVLINNAGNGAFGPLEAMPAEVVRDQFQVLVLAPVELIRRALPAMRERGRGTIINVTSLAGQFPIPFMAPYSAAKSALMLLTEGLRMELSNTPIRVVEVRPGDINTPFHKQTKNFGSTTDAQDGRRMKSAWETQSRNMAAAPPPGRVARAVLRAINAPHPPPVLVVGGVFQARVAPLAARFLPLRLLEYGLQRYYRL